jgi:gliding motility-associated-like protein
MKNFYTTQILYLLMTSLGTSVFANNATKDWDVKDPFDHKVFIENLGQVDGRNSTTGAANEKIYFSACRNGLEYHFAQNGFTLRFNIYEGEEEAEKEQEEKAEEPSFELQHLRWLGANPNCRISASGKQSWYVTFAETKEKGRASAYTSITYHELYEGIDVQYLIPDGKEGIKYNIILHPGADPSKIKMCYEGASTRLDGTMLSVKNSFAQVVEHAPVSFYSDSKESIASAFVVTGSTISFRLGNYDHNRTVIIDPWIVATTFTPAPNNAAYDIEYDAQGNVYIYGGFNGGVFEEMKYDNAGNLQWVYQAAPLGHYYGDFTVCTQSGTSYLVEGFRASGAKLVKVNSLGVQVALFPGHINFREAWRVQYNHCTDQVVLAGGGTTNSSYHGIVLDTNTVVVAQSNMLSTSEFGHDICMLAIDNSNNCYAAMARAAVHYSTFDNVMLKCSASTLFPLDYLVDDNHNFYEGGSVQYTAGSTTNGFNGIAVNNDFLFTYDGSLLQRWNKNTGALIDSVHFPNPCYAWGGIAADDCNNVYVGYDQTIIKLDTNFTVLATFNLPDDIYDLRLGQQDKLYACGRGFVAQFQLANPCNPLALNINYSPGQCESELPLITASVSGGLTPYSYSWSTGSSQPQASVSAMPAGFYPVTVTDGGCIPHSITDTAIIFENPNLHLQSVQNVFCKYDSTGAVVMSANQGLGPYSYHWFPFGGSDSAITNVPTGNYLAVVTSAHGCKDSLTATVAAPIDPIIATATVLQQPNHVLGTPAELYASGGSSYQWSPAEGLSCTDCPNPVADPLFTTKYCVTVVNDSGCIDEACTTVFISSVYVPNAFTPGQDQLNEVFRPVLNNVHRYRFTIFDRWGGKVFETEDQQEGWNGCRNGTPCEQSVYVYKITYVDDAHNKERELIGSVTLIR